MQTGPPAPPTRVSSSSAKEIDLPIRSIVHLVSVGCPFQGQLPNLFSEQGASLVHSGWRCRRFAEPRQLCNGEPMLPPLHQLADLIDAIVIAFD